jgi:hypothetical protein
MNDPGTLPQPEANLHPDMLIALAARRVGLTGHEFVRAYGEWTERENATQEQCDRAVMAAITVLASAVVPPKVERTTSLQAVDILGDELDLRAAYETEPPPRDDVLIGLEPGNVGVLGGQGGVSKSWFIGGLAHDLALAGTSESMRTMLAPATPQTVGFLTAEESVADLHRRFHSFGSYVSPEQREMCRKQITIRSLKRHVPVLMEQDGSINQATAEAITQFGSTRRLVVLDPLVRLVRADKSDEGMMTLLITTLEEMGAKAGCAFLFSHHSGKAAILQGNGASALALKGSTVLVDLSRWAAMLVRPPKTVAEKRSIDARDYRILVLDKANHTGECEMWFRRRTGGTLAYDHEQTHRDEVEEAMEAIKPSKAPRRATTLAAADDDDLPTMEEYLDGL